MRWVMAWICFWIGDAAHRCHLDALHYRMMIWSDAWQGDSDKGPWRPLNPEPFSAVTVFSGTMEEMLEQQRQLELEEFIADCKAATARQSKT